MTRNIKILAMRQYFKFTTNQPKENTYMYSLSVVHASL